MTQPISPIIGQLAQSAGIYGVQPRQAMFGGAACQPLTNEMPKATLNPFGQISPNMTNAIQANKLNFYA